MRRVVVTGCAALLLTGCEAASNPTGLQFSVTTSAGAVRDLASKLTFQSDRDGLLEVYVMNPDGSGQTNVTNHPANDVKPAFSPDGARIAFHSDRDGNFEVYVMSWDGSGLTRSGAAATLASVATGRSPTARYP